MRKQLVFVAFLITAGCAEAPVRSTPSGQQAATPTSSSDRDAAMERRTRDAQARKNSLGAEPSSKAATEMADAPRHADDFLDLMKAYKIATCNCRDHDRECGKAAADAFMRTMEARPAAFDMSAKPDPEMERLAEEIATCTKRVFILDPAAGSASAPSGP